MEKKKGASLTHCTKLEFPVIQVSDRMGWESGPVKKELKLLQWNFSQGIYILSSGYQLNYAVCGFVIPIQKRFQ